MSRPCEQCNQTKQCRMHLDRDGRPVYLCAPCSKDLNFTGKDR